MHLDTQKTFSAQFTRIWYTFAEKLPFRTFETTFQLSLFLILGKDLHPARKENFLWELGL